MTVKWIGAGPSSNCWQGLAADKENVPTPRNGDTFLDVENGILYTFQDSEWFPMNGGSS